MQGRFLCTTTSAVSCNESRAEQTLFSTDHIISNTVFEACSSSQLGCSYETSDLALDRLNTAYQIQVTMCMFYAHLLVSGAQGSQPFISRIWIHNHNEERNCANMKYLAEKENKICYVDLPLHRTGSCHHHYGNECYSDRALPQFRMAGFRVCDRVESFNSSPSTPLHPSFCSRESSSRVGLLNDNQTGHCPPLPAAET